jgi:general secretion pathway protein J
MTGTRGLSLIELVVAMAIFALVAVMGMQTLNGTIRTRDALSARDSRDRDLAVTLALLRLDLDHMAPLLFYPPEGPPQSALFQGGEGFGLSITAPVGAMARGVFQRSEWRLDRATGQLSRAVWPVITPARLNQRSPDRVLLGGVQSLRLRSYWAGRGWVAGTGVDLGPMVSAPDSADGDAAFGRVINAYSDSLPAAVEITLTLDGLGEIRMIEALQ